MQDPGSRILDPAFKQLFHLYVSSILFDGERRVEVEYLPPRKAQVLVATEEDKQKTKDVKVQGQKIHPYPNPPTQFNLKTYQLK